MALKTTKYARAGYRAIPLRVHALGMNDGVPAEHPVEGRGREARGISVPENGAEVRVFSAALESAVFCRSEPKIIDVFICKLRKKIAAAAGDPMSSLTL